MRKAVVAVYSHVEFYPPTMNAINAMCSDFEHIEILQRNTRKSYRTIQSNVSETNSGEYITIQETQNKSYWWKLKSFYLFTKNFIKILKQDKPALVLIYDPIPLLSYRIASFFVNTKTKIWYHNHDLLTKNNVTKYSISWFAMLNEQVYINKVDVFTLPSELRKSYFSKYDNEISMLPNYPSKKLIEMLKIDEVSKGNNLKIIYQGVIKNEHGLEEIIECLKEYTNVELSIVGFGSEDYLKKLDGLIQNYNVQDRVKCYPFYDNYEDLLKFTAKHDVGVGLYKPLSEMNKTMGTASNKIFEYIACGLRVLLVEDEFYKELFYAYQCVEFTDINSDSIRNAISNCLKEKSNNKKIANEAFQQEFYFEKKFYPILQSVLNDNH